MSGGMIQLVVLFVEKSLAVIITLLAGIIISGCHSDNDLMLMATMDKSQVETRCIWDKAPHCAFTDLTVYNGKLYCCFREGRTHVPASIAEHGGIRILVSDDGDTWRDCGLISNPAYDLRDPKLSVTPDNRLMLMYGRYLVETPAEPYPWTGVRFLTEDDIESSDLNEVTVQNVNIENNRKLSNYWLWRVKWIGDTAYGVAYKGGEWPLLVKSTDGINYTLVSVLQVAGNEADVELMEDGRMLIIIRGPDNHNGFIGTASNPFTDWSWTETDIYIHCPATITLSGHIFVAGRSGYGTTLFYYNNYKIYPTVAFESTDDNAYPGVAVYKGNLYTSYYSYTAGTSAIYLSSVPVDYLTRVVNGQ